MKSGPSAMLRKGKIVTIIIMQKFIMADLAFGDTVRQESPGDKRLITSGGRPVNMINETTHEVLGDLEKYIVTKV